MREICERLNHCKNHQIDAEDQFAASLADDLWSLPEKEKFMAKQAIRNVIFIYIYIYIYIYLKRSLIPQKQRN